MEENNDMGKQLQPEIDWAELVKAMNNIHMAFEARRKLLSHRVYPHFPPNKLPNTGDWQIERKGIIEVELNLQTGEARVIKTEDAEFEVVEQMKLPAPYDANEFSGSECKD